MENKFISLIFEGEIQDFTSGESFLAARQHGRRPDRAGHPWEVDGNMRTTGLGHPCPAPGQWNELFENL